MKTFNVGDIVVRALTNDLYKITRINGLEYECIDLSIRRSVYIRHKYAIEPTLEQYLKALKLQEEHNG